MSATQWPRVLTSTLMWEDHFTGPQGSAPTIAYTDGRVSDVADINWRPDIGDGSDGPGAGWGNNEAEYYIDDALQLDGSSEGCLRITATRTRDEHGLQGWEDNPYWQYVSGKITTAGTVGFHYGLIEGRIKVPTDKGSWSALWLLGEGLLQGTSWPQCGEIDVLEAVGQEPRHLLGTIHGPGYSGDAGVTQKIDSGSPLSDGFHTYAVLWLPDSITWYFDGEPFHHLTPADINGHEWVFNQPHYLIVNLAMGGNLGGELDDDVQSCELLVDFIRHSAVTLQDGGEPIGEVIRH